MPLSPDPLQSNPVTPAKLPHLDPRAVLASQIDTHLASVPIELLKPDVLRARFAESRRWEPEVWAERKFANRPPTRASVLVPVVMRERPTVLLTERTTHLSTHSGQVAFPGGKRDDTDQDDVHTALREAHEEIGLEASAIEVLGSLPLHTTGSQFLITPVVALVSPHHELKINAYEVADAFEVPLEFLMNPAHHRHHEVDWEGERREWLSMPYMDGNTERFIWGATAGMLRNLYRFLAA